MKKTIITALLLSFTSSTLHSKVVTKDPYESIEHFQLKNGLNVYLAPSSETNLTAIRLEVGVGWEVEDKDSWGLSHLLEHVLFRDKELREEMSYLQIIKEAGGSANGSTAQRVTSYFGSIPYLKGEWLLENFSKMILEPKIDLEYVQKEKGTVELEIGTPAAVTQVLGKNPIELINPPYLAPKNFWEKEFNLKFIKPFSVTQEQISNRKLTAQQVQQHYLNYYYPSNMRLFIAGKYDRNVMINFINQRWGSLQNRKGLSLPPLPQPRRIATSYVKELIGSETSTASLGIIASGLNLQESEVLSSYTKYLSHKLMKELRNRKGQTYYAAQEDHMYGTYGYTAVNFQSPNDNLEQNLKIAKDMIDRDTTSGVMSSTDIEEAKKLYLAEYDLKGKEAEVMMEYAGLYFGIQQSFGKFQSPYALIENINSEDYNKILKKYFVPQNTYEVINRSPYLFAYDYVFFYAIAAILMFSFSRSFLTKEFKNDRIKWVRKVKFPPLKILESLSLLVGWYVFLHLVFVVSFVIDAVPFLNNNLFMTMYSPGAIWIGLLIVTFQFFLSILPGKLMVVENTLFIKSISYYSKKIPLAEIDSVKVSRAVLFPFLNFKEMKKFKFRFYFYNLKFWKEGIIINLKNDKSYFFSVESAQQVKIELDQFINNQEKESKIELAA